MNLENIKKQLTQFAKQHNVPCISSATEQFLVQHLMKYKPQISCEIGSAIGLSTCVISDLIKQREGTLTSFEISFSPYMQAIYHLRSAYFFHTKVYRYDFRQAPLDRILAPQLDFVFIDAGKSEYGEYLKLLMPFCHQDTYIVCDDIKAYEDKVAHIYPILESLGRAYSAHALDDQDSLLLIRCSSSFS